MVRHSPDRRQKILLLRKAVLFGDLPASTRLHCRDSRVISYQETIGQNNVPGPPTHWNQAWQEKIGLRLVHYVITGHA